MSYEFSFVVKPSKPVLSREVKQWFLKKEKGRMVSPAPDWTQAPQGGYGGILGVSLDPGTVRVWLLSYSFQKCFELQCAEGIRF